MDDFLHNLRSGKLKQPDRGRRDYTDYKGPQRRAGNERRKPDYYAKVTSENFALVKDSLDVLANHQKRIADEMAARKKTDARIADALETLAAMLGRHWGYENNPLQNSQPDEVEPAQNGDARDGIAPGEAMDRFAGIDTGNQKISNEDKPRLLNIITAMRDEGDSWEKIARHMDQRDIPTVSGKGKWRGPAIKKFWEAQTEATGT
jgi:hypothetical protein